MAEQTEKKEEGKNCPSCKKIMKKSRRYYRNGAYYCNKNCYHNAVAKQVVAEAPAAQEAQEAK